MTGVWPGGGIFVIPAAKLDKHLAVYTTFGLSNPDMPATARSADVEIMGEGHRATRAASTLEKKSSVTHHRGAAGYGYEVIVVADDKLKWPIGVLDWAVDEQIVHDFDLLQAVEKHGGITVEDLQVTNDDTVNILITKAEPPLPDEMQLPDGRMVVLVATTVTDDEILWAKKNGQPALLRKLREAGVGQISHLGRTGVVQ